MSKQKNIKMIVFILIAFFFFKDAQAKPIAIYEFTIKEVYDGDTVKIEETAYNLPLSIRINGIDTPEKGHRAKCNQEKKLAEQAKKFLENLIKEANLIYFDELKWDKYGGRILANMYIDGLSVATIMIKEGFAREYHGEKKIGWCK